MTPYNGLLFFYVMGLLLLPAIALGLAERPIKHYGLLFTVAMLAFVFAENGQLLTLVGFYLCEMLIGYTYSRLKNKTGMVFWAAIGLGLAPLVLYKANEALGLFPALRLLGISYMTFRCVQVLIELHDGTAEQLDLADLSYFLLFFPAVSSGPIDRFHRFRTDLEHRLDRQAYIDLLRRGVWKLMWGAFSALVLSRLIWNLWLLPLPPGGLLPTVSYMYGYTFYLFFSFAGYSSMAIGTAYILGITLPENFNMPFFSVDMKDFWSRWHISLSTYLRDYLYARFVMDCLKKKRFKTPRTASYIGYILNMTVMGAWHGLTPAYLLYGVYHSLLMCINEALDLHWKPFRRLKQQGWTQAACVIVTFHLFSFGLLIFSGRLFAA